MEITYDILLEFENITSKNIGGFFERALSFFSSDYNKISGFYSGTIKTISSEPFNNFNLIKKERDEVMEIINLNARKLNNLKWFFLVEKVEEIDSRLRTLNNINKWARSSLTKVGYDPAFQVEYSLKQNQTLERVSQDVLGSSNPEDDWMDIALMNFLTEESYSPKGGTTVNLKLDKTNFNFNINSVVDIINGKSVYGKDLNKNFGFDSGEDDLKVLGYDETILQAIEILINLKKNDISSARNLGLQKEIVIGSNRAIMNFPIIIRQLSTTFASDDTLKKFNINQIEFEQDNLMISFDVQSRLNEALGDKVNI